MAYDLENFAGPKPRRKKPVRGESAADKAAIRPQGTTKSRYTDVVRGAQERIAQGYADDPVAGRIPAQPGGTRNRGVDRYAAAPVGIALFGDPDIQRGFRDTRDFARTALDVLTSPDTSRREKLEAAGGVGAVGGVFDFLPGRKPKPKPAVKPEGAEKVIEAMPEARRVRAEQEKLRSAQRKERVGKAQAAREEAGGGEAGLRASRAEMRGEYARLPFDRLAKEYGHADSELRKAFQPQVDAMLDFIAEHPSQAGLEFRIGNTQDALLKMLDGQSLQKAEIRALENVFGEEAEQFFKWRTARERALKLANLPRSLQASYDLSLMLRQLLTAGVRHPVLWKRVFAAQIKAVRSEKAAVAMLDEIRARPRYDQMLEDGVKLTDIRARPGQLEEDFIGAEIAGKIPVVGRGVRWSTRAFTVGGAKMRADLYDLFMDQAEAAGKTLSRRERQSLASVINASTGRGSMGVDILERAAPLGTVLLFSPRLIASRLAYFNPYWYATLKGPARKEAASQLLSVIALGSAVLWMAKQLGAEVEADPRSSDFGKIRVGDTRVDIWGGFQQYVVNGWRYIRAETKTTGGEVRKKSREEIAWNFGSGKLAPLPGLGRDLQRGRTFDYQPVNESVPPVPGLGEVPYLGDVPYGNVVGKLFVPLNIQNAADAAHDPGLAGLSLGLGGLGLGVGTYPDSEDEKPRPASGRPRSSGGRYRGSRSRYQGGPGRNFAGPRR